MTNSLKYLIDLFDDTNEIVTNAVNENMISRGISVINELTRYYHCEESEETKWHIAEKIQFLYNEFTLRELGHTAETEDIDLERAFFLISKLLNPDLDEIYFRDILSVLSEDLKKEITEEQTALEKVKIFNHIFYKRLLFRCMNGSITRESTNNIVSVMSSRNGSPLIIALIFFLLARSINLNIYPIILSAGLVPAYVEKNSILFYIDINREGELFSQDRLGEYGNTFEIREDRVLAIIYMELLAHLYSMKNDTERYNLINRALNLFGEERFLERDEREE